MSARARYYTTSSRNRGRFRRCLAWIAARQGRGYAWSAIARLRRETIATHDADYWRGFLAWKAERAARWEAAR